MYNSKFHLHFIGIGGVGMAGIAEILLNLGYSISGSDMAANSLVKHLQDLGAQVGIGHSIGNLPVAVDTVVLSSAIAEDNVELVEARKRKVPVIQRAEMLAELMRMKFGVAVAGSHGKTTTTSMTSTILNENGLDPTVIVGGRVLSQTTGAKLGTSQYLVAEADESDGSFSHLRPAIAVVTNIDSEHLSFYGTFDALEKAFVEFMSSVPFYGLVIACGDDPILAKIIPNLKKRVFTYGLSPDTDLRASDIKIHGINSEFTLHYLNEEVGRYQLPMPGVHMVRNALAAIAVGIELGVDPKSAAQALAAFPGVSRRTELVHRGNGVITIDDYAHHPKEISSTLRGIRRGVLPKLAEDSKLGELGRIIAVFQPHRFGRTKELFSDFLNCFGDVDKLFVTDIYPAGESPIEGITSQALVSAIQHDDVEYVSNIESVSALVLNELRVGDVVVTLGAGSIGSVSRKLAEEIAANFR